MRRFIVFTAIVCLMACFPAAMVGQTTHLKFTQSGEFASLSESTGPNSSFSLSVARNTVNGVTTANINYQATSVAADFSSITFTQIVGAIPAADFTGQNTQNLALSFNTSDLDPSAFSQTCTLDLIVFTFTCGAGPTGTISLTFRQTGQLSTEVLLSQEQTVGPVTTRIHQRSDNSTATATGTVFGTSALGGNATVGINHSSTLEAIK
jgi:hypothetical protein